MEPINPKTLQSRSNLIIHILPITSKKHVKNANMHSVSIAYCKARMGKGLRIYPSLL